MSKELWIFAEHKDNSLRKVVFELLSAGKKISQQLGQKLCAVVMGEQGEEFFDEIAQYGAEKIYLVNDLKLKEYTTDGYTYVLANLMREYNPEIILLGHTAIGKDLAPRVAQRIDAGLVSDCIEINVHKGNLLFTRPIYAGKAFSRIKFKNNPVIATVRPNVLEVVKNEVSQPEIIKVDLKIGPEVIRTIVQEIIKQTSKRVELTEANIIVSGGRGMKGPENFAILEELADILGAAVGASRAAVDAGWRAHADQVGQTGKVVSPTVYIACGISGAIQHLAGMSSSKVIIAINKDPEANIFNVADYGIVGDLFDIVPRLTEEFKKVLAS